MRWRMLCVEDRAPSAVCSMETPSSALRTAMFMPLIWARIFSLMASPAASSAALLIRRPVESFWMDFWSALLVLVTAL